ncbi:hypothetical protein [Longimicrobium sp.]|jgi:hypothetical protein|uniref:hypothetical protein n=1 Tax=Longimicrobium sp. TaxID=2029185 RepID=UPI002F92FBFE
MKTIDIEVALVTISCCNCGITFGVPSAWEVERRRTHAGFHCPNGHSLVFNGETAEQKRIRELQARVDQEAARRKRAEENEMVQYEARKATERKLSATRGVVTRLKSRTQAGKCPCCETEFANLRQHMARQHPGFTADADAPSGANAVPGGAR